ncbi:hypothetical protein PROFUN_14541 [Planoprotostelium fungivorum]|uniref:Uncharacterized protein n=1 Tax=Planoprotostelium fungivorum TaxID=1890364 RepID=A0A2P6MZK0_9EUKA|nr:hypothetical protein PROFUN_14541 [Planoprotostelium fungivorum]
MPSGNGAKAAQRRERVAAQKNDSGPKSQLKSNEKALTIKCKICMQTFLGTTAAKSLKEHSDNKHPKNAFAECFDSAPPS